MTGHSVGRNIALEQVAEDDLVDLVSFLKGTGGPVLHIPVDPSRVISASIASARNLSAEHVSLATTEDIEHASGSIGAVFVSARHDTDPSPRHAGPPEESDSPLPDGIRCVVTNSLEALLGKEWGRAALTADQRDVTARGRTLVDHYDSMLVYRVPLAHRADAPIETRLRQARAARELQRLREARLAVEASDNGLTQRAIGELLGRSQTDIFRMLKIARHQHSVGGGDSSVRELVLQYATGEIGRGTLIGRLTDLQRGHTEGGGLVDGYSHGSFDDVKTAWLDGLIDDELYEEIRDNNTPTPAEDTP